MQQNYSKKIDPIQKASKNTASSVLDASSQSEALQHKADMANNAAQREEAPRPNNTGMPDNLKSGIESLSGFSMDDVRVHYNSSKPATVQALAYTQGTDIHVAPGQEKHLPHEAWHVAQQMAGRVSPTTNINGMPVNDNAGLEHEADVMGERAEKQTSSIQLKKTNNENVHLQKNICQLALGRLLETGMLNVVGEQHDESDTRRQIEKNYATWLYGINHYWQEFEFSLNQVQYGDSPAYRFIHAFYDFNQSIEILFSMAFKHNTITEREIQVVKRFYNDIQNEATPAMEKTDIRNYKLNSKIVNAIVLFAKEIKKIVNTIFNNQGTIDSAYLFYLKSVYLSLKNPIILLISQGTNQTSDTISRERSDRMHEAANAAMRQGIKGIWKIGDDHVNDIRFNKSGNIRSPINYNLLSKKNFDEYFSPPKTKRLRQP